MTGVILMYHRVAIAPEDAYGLAVAPDRFAGHVEHLARLGCVVPLEEILKPARALQIAVTFDDGYSDNAITAAPMIAGAGLPATYFITSGRLGGRHFWWDRLAVGILGDYGKPAGVDVSVAGRGLWLALNSPEACRTSLSFLHRRLRPLPPDELLTTVDEILTVLDAPDPPVDGRTMSEEQLRALALLPAAEVGAHTRTHLQLKGQQRRLQQREVMGSIDDISTLLGRQVTSFAYPFGSQSAVGDLAPRIAREAGCVVACSTEHAPVSQRPDPHLLPRLNVGDWEARELAVEIGRIAGLA